MAEKDHYYLYVENTLVEVTPEVYHAYYHIKDQERHQEDKKRKHGVFSYDAMDADGLLGVEAFPDTSCADMDVRLMEAEETAALYKALSILPSWDRALIDALYFENTPISQYAKTVGQSISGINKRRRRILSKLRSFMNVLGSFLVFVPVLCYFSAYK